MTLTGVAELTRTRFCDHMRSVIDFCRLLGVEIDGCGEYGCPALVCQVCGRRVEQVSAVFDPLTGGQPAREVPA